MNSENVFEKMKNEMFIDIQKVINKFLTKKIFFVKY